MRIKIFTLTILSILSLFTTTVSAAEILETAVMRNQSVSSDKLKTVINESSDIALHRDKHFIFIASRKDSDSLTLKKIASVCSGLRVQFFLTGKHRIKNVVVKDSGTSPESEKFCIKEFSKWSAFRNTVKDKNTQSKSVTISKMTYRELDKPFGLCGPYETTLSVIEEQIAEVVYLGTRNY